MRSDYSKVEKILEEGLMKISVHQLLKLADLAAGMGSKHTTPSNEKYSTSQLAIIIKNELNWIEKHDVEIYKKLGIKRKETRHLLDHPQKIDAEEKEKLKNLKSQLDEYKREILTKLVDNSDDKLIVQERERHINKRFNVNERWLPLK